MCVDDAGAGPSGSTAPCGGARCSDATAGTAARRSANACRGTAAGGRRCTTCRSWWPRCRATSSGSATARDDAGARDAGDFSRRADA